MVVLGFIIAILGLGLLIFVHELGHFAVGKALGLKITEFFIGLPIGRALVSRTRGETTYGIKPVLFGGYVKFPEFLEIYKTDVETIEPGSPAQKAGLIANDQVLEIDGRKVKSWLDIFNTVKTNADRTLDFKILRKGVEEVLSVDIGLRKDVGWLGAGPTSTDDITIDDLPVTIEGQGFIKKVLVMVAGSTMNIFLALMIMIGALLIGFSEPTSTIDKVMSGSPAQKSGIKAGDTILSIAGKKTPSWKAVTSVIKRNAGRTVDLNVERGESRLHFNIALRKKSKEGVLGVVTRLQRRPRGLVEAVTEGSGFIYQASGLILDLLAKLVTNPKSVLGQLRSPIGAVTETAPIAQRDIMEYLVTLAGISMAIGIFNLLPIPPLDGGRVVISAIESLIRRPMPKESLVFVNVIGVSLLLTLMAYVIVADVFRLVAPGSS